MPQVIKDALADAETVMVVLETLPVEEWVQRGPELAKLHREALGTRGGIWIALAALGR